MRQRRRGRVSARGSCRTLSSPRRASEQAQGSAFLCPAKLACRPRCSRSLIAGRAREGFVGDFMGVLAMASRPRSMPWTSSGLSTPVNVRLFSDRRRFPVSLPARLVAAASRAKSRAPHRHSMPFSPPRSGVDCASPQDVSHRVRVSHPCIPNGDIRSPRREDTRLQDSTCRKEWSSRSVATRDGRRVYVSWRAAMDAA